MKIAPLPKNEKGRLAALRELNILDSDFEKDYDELAELASFICDTPIAMISLVDENRQWFKAKIGIEARETPRDHAFCAHAILNDELFIVNDTFKDKRFSDNPLVLSDPNIRFYAGAPLITDDGYSLGTICTIDRKPKELNHDQKNALRILAKQVMKQFELRRAVKRMQVYSKEIYELNLSKDKFFSIMAHDLRSPFNSILGYSKILLDEIDTLDKEQIKEFTRNLGASTNTAFTLVDNLLNWSLLESGKIQKKVTKFELSELFREVKVLLSGIAAKKQIKIIIEPADGIFISADRNMIFSVIQNLVSNSLKFTNENGSIVLSAEVKEDNVIVKVKDFGIGMTDEQLDSLFKLDSQVSGVGTQGEKGSGFGLLLCKQFVEINNGELEVESTVNEGATFSITLPQN